MYIQQLEREDNIKRFEKKKKYELEIQKAKLELENLKYSHQKDDKDEIVNERAEVKQNINNAKHYLTDKFRLMQMGQVISYKKVLSTNHENKKI